MDLLLTESIVYLAASVFLTVWVGRTLFRNGRRFLVDVMDDEALGDSVNQLLLVGFYLLNLGIDALLLNTAGGVDGAAAVVRTLATQLGVVLLLLGVVHLGNVYVLNRLRRNAQARAYAQWYHSQVKGTTLTQEAASAK
jgi:hypothetical protein